MPQRSALIWLALGLAAAVVDAQSLQAALWLSRCTTGDTAAAIGAALRVDEHAQAFPWTMLVMVLRCFRPAASHRDAAVVFAGSLLVMLLLMPAVCLASALVVELMPPSARPLGYAALMVSISALPGFWSERPAAARERLATCLDAASVRLH